MAWIDQVIIVLIGFSTIVSLIRGFVRESLSLLTWVSACLASSYFCSYLTDNFVHFTDELVRNSILTVIVFIAILIIGAIFSHKITPLVGKIWLSGTDRLLGVFFGILRGVLFITGILFYINSFTDLLHSEEWKNSQFIPYFNYIIKWISIYLQSRSTVLLDHLP